MKITKLNARYGNKIIFKDFDFEVKDGSTVALMGRSGIGKSTLLSCISDSCSQDLVYSFEECTFSKFCAFSFQEELLLPDLTLVENVALPLMDLYGKVPALEIAAVYLEKVNLSNKKDSFPEQCSGGEKGRASLARAFCFLECACPEDQKPLLILDEPFKSQDEKTKASLIKFIKEKSFVKPVTTIIVTHSHLEAALIQADSIINLDQLLPV